MRSKALRGLLSLLILLAPAAGMASTGCNYTSSLDSWSDKVAGDFWTVADVNQLRCAVEKLESTVRSTQYGGTGADFSATAQGNILYFSSAGVLSALPPGTSGKFLQTLGAGANPQWATAPMKMAYNGTAQGLQCLNGETDFFALSGSPTAGCQTSEVRTQTPMAIAGTFKNFYFRTSGSQPASGTLVATIRKNGVDTAVTVTIPANGAAQTVSDTSNSFSVAAGDLIGIKTVNNAATSSANIGGWSIEFDPS